MKVLLLALLAAAGAACLVWLGYVAAGEMLGNPKRVLGDPHRLVVTEFHLP